MRARENRKRTKGSRCLSCSLLPHCSFEIVLLFKHQKTFQYRRMRGGRSESMRQAQCVRSASSPTTNLILFSICFLSICFPTSYTEDIYQKSYATLSWEADHRRTSSGHYTPRRAIKRFSSSYALLLLCSTSTFKSNTKSRIPSLHEKWRAWETMFFICYVGLPLNELQGI